MFGGGSRRDDGSLVINNTNVFAALDTLKKKKKSDKDKKKKNKASKSTKLESESESQVFWAPAPLNATSWADVDDDDDYYATTAPPQNVWTASDSHQSEDKPENFEVYLYYLDTFLLLCYNPFLCAYVMIMSCFCLDSIALCLWNQDMSG
jgi:hypothetical protein